MVDSLGTAVYSLQQLAEHSNKLVLMNLIQSLQQHLPCITTDTLFPDTSVLLHCPCPHVLQRCTASFNTRMARRGGNVGEGRQPGRHDTSEALSPSHARSAVAAACLQCTVGTMVGRCSRTPCHGLWNVLNRTGCLQCGYAEQLSREVHQATPQPSPAAACMQQALPTKERQDRCFCCCCPPGHFHRLNYSTGRL
jgi:hypothetical protein